LIHPSHSQSRVVASSSFFFFFFANDDFELSGKN
jgi:hypothetical protein